MGKISKAIARFGAPPDAILFDDGELDLFDELLDEFNLEYARWSGHEVKGLLPMPMRLLIATCERFLELPAIREKTAFARPTHIAVAPPDTPYDLQRLQEIGADYVIHLPIRRSTLRLLLLRLLYRGPEKRNAERTVIGLGVRYQAGPRQRKALLADLSLDGCRLISHYGACTNIAVAVEIEHESLCRSTPLTLTGKIVRAVTQEPAQESSAYGREVLLAIKFDPPSEAERKSLEKLLQHYAVTPASGNQNFQEDRHEKALHSWGPMPPPAKLSFDDDVSGEHPLNERRHDKRAAFDNKVTALTKEASRILMARDLSSRGMRLQPHPEISQGAKLQLALHGSSLDQPLIVSAEVVRDDGPNGLAVIFTDLAPGTVEKLELLVHDLPSIESVEAESLVDTMFAEMID